MGLPRVGSPSLSHPICLRCVLMPSVICSKNSSSFYTCSWWESRSDPGCCVVTSEPWSISCFSFIPCFPYPVYSSHTALIFCQTISSFFPPQGLCIIKRTITSKILTALRTTGLHIKLGRALALATTTSPLPPARPHVTEAPTASTHSIPTLTKSAPAPRPS